MLRLSSFFLLLALAAPLLSQPEMPRLERMTGKTILVFTPHPDDEHFCCAGTLAILARNKNNIHVVLYTNDDKGSADPDMTSERLARIRKAEEEAASRVVGIPVENLHWLNHHDGMLEYVPAKELVEQVTAIIRKFRPDVVLAPDPGGEYVRWHKTDHRMAANNTIDAIRAAEWHLYFPNQRLHQGLQPWKVPMMFFYYTGKDANYYVDVTAEIETKLNALAAHVSQFEPSVSKYRPDWDPGDLKKMKDALRSRYRNKDGKFLEAYRAAFEYSAQ
jgi:LmbE family N-acetylglucosaminyl deacetylase